MHIAYFIQVLYKKSSFYSISKELWMKSFNFIWGILLHFNGKLQFSTIMLLKLIASSCFVLISIQIDVRHVFFVRQ